MRQRGFSLIELVVAAAIFLVLSLTIFSFFRYGTRSFQSAASKQGLQAEALRIADSLQIEMRRSGFGGITVFNDSPRALTVDSELVARDVVNFCSIKDWQAGPDDVNYDIETGAPLWNLYWTYYATLDSPVGKLVKHKVEPNPPPHAPTPIISDDLSNMIANDPLLNTFDGKTPEFVVLSPSVLSFSINRPEDSAGVISNPGLLLNDGRFDILVKLRKRHEREAGETGARRDFDYYQINFSVSPENSFPNNFQNPAPPP